MIDQFNGTKTIGNKMRKHASSITLDIIFVLKALIVNNKYYYGNFFQIWEIKRKVFLF